MDGGVLESAPPDLEGEELVAGILVALAFELGLDLLDLRREIAALYEGNGLAVP
jgi:hypothetical protein